MQQFDERAAFSREVSEHQRRTDDEKKRKEAKARADEQERVRRMEERNMVLAERTGGQLTTTQH